MACWGWGVFGLVSIGAGEGLDAVECCADRRAFSFPAGSFPRSVSSSSGAGAGAAGAVVEAWEVVMNAAACRVLVNGTRQAASMRNRMIAPIRAMHPPKRTATG